MIHRKHIHVETKRNMIFERNTHKYFIEILTKRLLAVTLANKIWQVEAERSGRSFWKYDDDDGYDEVNEVDDDDDDDDLGQEDIEDSNLENDEEEDIEEGAKAGEE